MEDDDRFLHEQTIISLRNQLAEATFLLAQSQAQTALLRQMIQQATEPATKD